MSLKVCQPEFVDAAAPTKSVTLKDLQRQFTKSGLCDLVTKLRKDGLFVAMTQQENFRGHKGRSRQNNPVAYTGKPVIEGIIADSAQHYARAVRFQINEDGVFYGDNRTLDLIDRSRLPQDINLCAISDSDELYDALCEASEDLIKTCLPPIHNSLKVEPRNDINPMKLGLPL